MSDDGRAWDMRRVEHMRSSMTTDQIAALKAKGQANPAALTLDEVGVLFLFSRERIREIERTTGDKDGRP